MPRPRAEDRKKGGMISVRVFGDVADFIYQRKEEKGTGFQWTVEHLIPQTEEFKKFMKGKNENK